MTSMGVFMESESGAATGAMLDVRSGPGGSKRLLVLSAEIRSVSFPKELIPLLP